MSPFPSETDQTSSRVVIVGDSAGVPTHKALEPFDVALFLDWRTCVAFSESHSTPRAEYIEMDGYRRDIEADAWRSANAVSLVAAEGAGHARELTGRVALVTRRLLQHGLGFEAARARLVAKCLADRITDGASVSVIGLDPITGRFLGRELAARGLHADGWRPEELSTAALPGVPLAWARSLQGTARFLARSRGRQRASAAARALKGQHGSLLAFISQAPRDEAIAGPSVALLRSEGAAVAKLDLSPSEKVMESGYESDLLESGRLWSDPYPADLLLRHTSRRRRAEAAIRTALPVELEPIAAFFSAHAFAHASVTAPAALRMCERLLGDIAPDRLVVLGETNRIVEPLAHEANAANRPITCVQHGIIHDIPQWAEMPFSTFAVYGPAYAEVLTTLGTPDTHVAVTGDPRLDAAIVRQPRPRGEVLRSLGGAGAHAGDNTKVVLFAANYTSHRLSGSSMERAFGALVTAMQRAKAQDTLLVIKLHPQGAGRELPYERVLARAGDSLRCVIAPRDSVLVDLIAASDAVAVHVSSVGFEATAMRKPLVVINTDEGLQEVPFTREGVAREARNAEELTGLLQAVFDETDEPVSDEVLERFNARYNGDLNGLATRRLADAIKTSAW